MGKLLSVEEGLSQQRISQGRMRIDDRVAIITGSSRGIGRAAALLFAEQGADVVVNYNSDESAATAVVSRIRELGRRAVAVQANIGDIPSHVRLVEAALDEFGRIDILYHNAGIHYVAKTLEDVTEEVWDMTYDALVKGAFFLTKRVVPHMQEGGGGSVLFTSTSSASVIVPVDPHYMSAKSAINLLVKLLAGWLAPQIRVNCVVPGLIETDMFRHHPPAVWKGMAASLPLGRMGTPLDVAKTALFLVSSEAEYITGCAIPVDGGRMAALPRASFQAALDQMLPGLQLYDLKEYEEAARRDIASDLVETSK